MAWNPLNALLGLFSRDIGIDLGTANTLVLVGAKDRHQRAERGGDEPEDEAVLAVGAEAKQMVGRTPANIVAVRPLRDGVISDFDVTEQMLRYFIEKVHEQYAIIPRPRVVIGIPSGVTEVERRAVHDATINAGAREVFLIEEPMAAAIGAGLPVQDAAGSMIVDIGGGTTEVAVISLGGIVGSRSIRIAGDEMDQDIITYMRQRYNLLIGERMAEEIEDRRLGLPRADRRAGPRSGNGVGCRGHRPRGDRRGDGRHGERDPGRRDGYDRGDAAELVADLMVRGIVLAGGGALLPGLVEQLAERTRMRIIVADDPLGCVVRGAGQGAGRPGPGCAGRSRRARNGGCRRAANPGMIPQMEIPFPQPPSPAHAGGGSTYGADGSGSARAAAVAVLDLRAAAARGGGRADARSRAPREVEAFGSRLLEPLQATVSTVFGQAEDVASVVRRMTEALAPERPVPRGDRSAPGGDRPAQGAGGREPRPAQPARAEAAGGGRGAVAGAGDRAGPLAVRPGDHPGTGARTTVCRKG